MVFKLWVTPTCSQGEQPPRKRAGRERKWRRGLGVEGTRAVSCPRTQCGHFPWELSLDLHLRPGDLPAFLGRACHLLANLRIAWRRNRRRVTQSLCASVASPIRWEHEYKPLPSVAMTTE